MWLFRCLFALIQFEMNGRRFIGILHEKIVKENEVVTLKKFYSILQKFEVFAIFWCIWFD